MPKRFVFILFLMLLVIPSAYATFPAPTVNSARFNCDQVSINYSTNLGGGNLTFGIFDGSNPNTSTLLGTFNHGVADGTFSATISLSSEQPSGTTLYIFASVNGGDYGNANGTTSGNCRIRDGDEPFPVPYVPPYRQFGGEGARAGIFIITEENGSNNNRLTLYDINEEGEGNLLFFISINAVNAEYEANGETQLIFQNVDELISFYRLADGLFQVNLGPDAEGKMHIMRFDWEGNDPFDVIYETYSIFDLSIFNVMRAFPFFSELIAVFS